MKVKVKVALMYLVGFLVMATALLVVKELFVTTIQEIGGA